MTQDRLRWTKERAEQLNRLMDLVRIAGSLNYATNICGNIAKCQELAVILNEDTGLDCDGYSFMSFLHELAIEGRKKGE